MKNLRELLVGLSTALASLLIVLGALSLSVAENMVPEIPVPTMPPATATVVEYTPTPLLSAKTQVIVPTTPSPLPSGTLVKTLSPTPAGTAVCQPPQGWVRYTIQAGDSLESLARSRQSTKAALKAGNCLLSDTLLPNTVIFLPPAPPTTHTPQPTATVIQCLAPPYGWTVYTVQFGDTLNSLSYRYQISVPELQKYNCLGNSFIIKVGQRLFVPFRPTVIPTNTPVSTFFPTATRPALPTSSPYPTSTADINQAPTDLTLSNDSLMENQNAGTLIGTFTTADPTPGDSHTLTLVSADGGPFSISGTSLIANAPLNYEARSLYNLRVRTTDRGGKSLEKTFFVTVQDVNEAPTAITLSGSAVTSGQPAGTVVGVLLTNDVDNGDSHTYNLFGGETGPFSLQGNILVTNTVLDANLKSSYNITIRSTDRGGLSLDQQFFITVLPAP